MPPEFRCERCGEPLNIPLGREGEASCPHCGQKVSAASLRSGAPDADSLGADPTAEHPRAANPSRHKPRPRPHRDLVPPVMSWIISIVFHVGLGLIMTFVAMIVIGTRFPDQITIPDAVLAETPGGVMKPSEDDEEFDARKPSPLDEPTRSPRDSTIDTGETEERIQLIGATDGHPSSPFSLDSGGEMSVRSSFYGRGGNAHHIVYVVDRSGSMLDSFDYVRLEMLKSISRLSERQDFHVILFAAGAPFECPPKRLVPAKYANKEKAAEFLSGIHPEGRTDPSPALKRAFEVLSRSDRRPGKLIYLLTDGVFMDNQKVLDAIRKANPAKKVLINTYLYGHRPPAAVDVMKKIAEENGGRYRYVPADE